LIAVALSAALLSTVGCDSVVDPSRAPVIYILYREYLHKHPGLTRLSPEDERYQQYLERRCDNSIPPGDTRGWFGMRSKR
jgi:hypothetical protein